MENDTEIMSFVLTMYGNVGNFKVLYFTLTLLFYISVIVANTVLIVVIYLEQSLHEPMYLFLCSLFINAIYGSTSLMPCLMAQILSDTHEISLYFCFLQIFNINTYAGIEFWTLSVMAYDRYVCICKPLHYNTIVTKVRVQVVIVMIWMICFAVVVVSLSFTIRVKFCGTMIHEVICENHLVVKLACSPNRLVSFIHDIGFGLIFVVTGPLTFISFTYVRILSVCLKSSSETKRKALDTCTPHLVSLLSFAFACFYNLIIQRFDMSFVPFELRVILALYGLIIQPLLNPLIYGLRLSKVRNSCQKLLTLKTFITAP